MQESLAGWLDGSRPVRVHVTVKEVFVTVKEVFVAFVV